MSNLKADDVQRLIGLMQVESNMKAVKVVFVDEEKDYQEFHKVRDEVLEGEISTEILLKRNNLTAYTYLHPTAAPAYIGCLALVKVRSIYKTALVVAVETWTEEALIKSGFSNMRYISKLPFEDESNELQAREKELENRIHAARIAKELQDLKSSLGMENLLPEQKQA